MPLTPNLTVVEITGTYVDIEGNPVAGQVRFTPRATLLDPIYEQIIIASTVSATLDSNGSISIYLPATDDPDTTPTGFTYQVEEAFVGGRTFDIAVPKDTVGALDLATLVPAVSSAGTASLYVSVGQYNGINARLIVVEGYSTNIGTAAISGATASAQAVIAAQQATIAAEAAAAQFNPLLLAGS